MTPQDIVTRTIAGITPLDQQAIAEATARQGQLTKPPGALGLLEDVSITLAGIQGVCPPASLARPAVAVFAGDHGVLAQGVSPWPQEVTLGMVANFRAGGAAVNVLAKQAGAEVYVVDMGVAAPLEAGGNLIDKKVALGTADLRTGPAMTRHQAIQAVAAGIEVAERLIDSGHDCLLTGDMGIGNTTPSAALIAAFTGAVPADVTGRGTGIDDPTLALKIEVVTEALTRPRGDALDTLAQVGGFEHGGIAGFILGAAARKVPVILDGVIAGSAALLAQALSADAIGYCLAGHRSVEPGHAVALAQLGLRPLVDLDLRLGEGTGAALAFPIVEAAGAVLREMATFDSAGVANKDAR